MLAGLVSRDDLANTVTWKSLSPVSRDPSTMIPGSRLTGLIFVVVNKRAETQAAQALVVRSYYYFF